MKFAAFLRGLNVGGNKKVPMSDLKILFESLGFGNVRTLLNSGNVVFEGQKADAKNIEKMLEEQFGFNISVIIRNISDIEKLIKSNPFEGIEVTPQTKLYVTFLKEKSNTNLASYKSHPGRAQDRSDHASLRFWTSQNDDKTCEVLSVLTLSPKFGTTEAMGILEKEFGKKVTTRNWNTIVKLTTL